MQLSEAVEIFKKTTDRIKTLRIYHALGYPLSIIYVGIPLRRWARKELTAHLSRLGNILNELDNLVSHSAFYAQEELKCIVDEDTFLIYPRLQKVTESLDNSRRSLEYLRSQSVIFPQSLNLRVIDSLAIIATVEHELRRFNTQFVARRKEDYSWLWKKSTIPLDDGQKNAIVTDDKHNLVVAGAGAGKTQVLITRVAYLLSRGPDTVKPERVLVLAYQRDAAEEIRHRLKEKFDVDVKVKTFHALGREIVTAKNPAVSMKFSSGRAEKEYVEFMGMLLNRLQADPHFRQQIIFYLEHYDDEDPKDTADFETKELFYKYMRELRYGSLDGTVVRSQQERAIMNFFIMRNYNGQRIRIIYENPAEWMDKQDPARREIKPDFFFPDFQVYLEHWGLSKDGTVPYWFDQTSEQYRASMEYKKQQFRLKNKKLIETFSYEFESQGFFDQLEERFLKALKETGKANGSNKLELAPYDQFVNRVWQESKELLNTLPDKVATFIRIAKTEGLKPNDLYKRLENEKWSKKQRAFAAVAIRTFEEYQKELSRENKIDFQDMINLAVEELQRPDNQIFRGAFDQILVDEYQDINKQRYQLLKALMDINPPCRLFCVGDDWQSIMGFTGSNLEYFVHFEDYFDHPAKTLLRINYRSAKKIVQTSTQIIKQNIIANPGSQTSKEIESISPISGSIVEWSSHYRNKNYYYAQMIRHCIETIREELKVRPPHEIMILQRIRNYDLMNRLLELANDKNIKLVFDADGDINGKIPLRTIHGSKGLQSQVVFLLDVTRGLKGLPCEIEDSDVFDLAKDKTLNHDKIDEERRLFYVAVTRAKEKVHIYTQQTSESQFLDEIKDYLEIKRLET